MLKVNRIICFVFLFQLFISVTYASDRPGPKQTLEISFNKGFVILDDANQTGKEEQLWGVINELFDFRQISMLVIGPHWKNFTKEEEKEFTDIFKNFLGNSYLNRLKEAYKGKKIDCLDEYIVKDKKAVVNTVLITNEAEIPIDYSMIKEGDKWKIYNIKVEGVSLIQNYRNQFGQILLKKQPRELIEQIKNKVEDK